jgi:hypothetical protein
MQHLKLLFFPCSLFYFMERGCKEDNETQGSPCQVVRALEGEAARAASRLVAWLDLRLESWGT